MALQTDIINRDSKFRYMLLSRLQMDCKYFLGNGNRHEKHLWAGNVEEHINAMRMLWNSFPEDEKPQWITIEEIEKYATEML